MAWYHRTLATRNLDIRYPREINACDVMLVMSSCIKISHQVKQTCLHQQMYIGVLLADD